jgi:hypothetical protein
MTSKPSGDVPLYTTETPYSLIRDNFVTRFSKFYEFDELLAMHKKWKIIGKLVRAGRQGQKYI